jgi:hypothetical protein
VWDVLESEISTPQSGVAATRAQVCEYRLGHCMHVPIHCQRSRAVEIFAYRLSHIPPVGQPTATRVPLSLEEVLHSAQALSDMELDDL